MSSKRLPNQLFGTLRQFIRERMLAEQCDFCSAELPSEHNHLIELSNRQMICACSACVVLFSGQRNGRYRRVPERVRFLPDFQMTDAQWDSLMIPIGMAFLFNSTTVGRVVSIYPSPAGAMESLLTLESWEEIAQNNPSLKEMESDVEALLINRVGNTREYYIVPIDECYKLVGLIRIHWRGLSGGSEVWEEIKRFFSDLREKSVDMSSTPDGFDGGRSPISGGEHNA